MIGRSMIQFFIFTICCWQDADLQGGNSILDDNNNDDLFTSYPTVENSQIHFVTENHTTITAQTGSIALIPCVVNNLGEELVSWIRRKDYHLLTVGLTTYSSDERFQTIHLHQSGNPMYFKAPITEQTEDYSIHLTKMRLDWTLQIKYVQKRDAGLYECQVSSHPPSSIFIQLNVVEARAEIQGPGEKYLKLGSGLRLRCDILFTTEEPIYVFWYHNNRMINYDVDRGINVTSTLTTKTSIITIKNATTHHSGNYSCVPSNAEPASTYVHILNGENPAAMQHGARGLSWISNSPSSWLFVLFVASLIC